MQKVGKVERSSSLWFVNQTQWRRQEAWSLRRDVRIFVAKELVEAKGPAFDLRICIRNPLRSQSSSSRVAAPPVVDLQHAPPPSPARALIPLNSLYFRSCQKVEEQKLIYAEE